MPRISTDKLQPGMTLESDVKDLSGRLLLKSGTVLENKHLRVLRTWGIAGIAVAGVGGAAEARQDEAPVELPPETMARLERKLAERFAGVDLSHPVMDTLWEMVRRKLVRECQQERADG